MLYKNSVRFNLAIRIKKSQCDLWVCNLKVPERIYNPITAMGFSAMFTFQLDNTKR